MKQQLTDQVKFLHKVVIMKTEQGQPRALILKRNNLSSRPGAWDLPGGNAEWPQAQQSNVADLHQLDIAREVKEESNLSVNHEIFDLDHLLFLMTYFEADRQIYTIICGWGINFTDTDQALVKISDEHLDQAWISLEELDNYNFGEAKGEFVKDMIKNAFARLADSKLANSKN